MDRARYSNDPYRPTFAGGVRKAVGRQVRSAGRRIVSSAVGAAASRIHPGLGLAYKAGKMAYGAYKMYKSFRGKKEFKAKTRYTDGGFAGKVRVSRKFVRNSFDSYNKYGCVEVRESLGNVTDPDSVYIINESVNTRDAIFYMIGAFMRKLIEKAGLRITGYNSAIVTGNAGATNETPYSMRVISQNVVSGAETIVTFTILANSSFGEMVTFFVPTFEEYSAGYGRFSTSNSNELYKAAFIQGTETPIVLADMLFNETFVDIMSKSDMKVQNRTVATGGSADAENVSNNPLQGRLYLFRGVPKPKANGRDISGTNGALYPFERIGYPAGRSAFGGNLAGLGTDLKEPPFPKLFWNCYKAGSIRLDPGQIKQYSVVAKKKGNILKMLKSLRLNMDSVGSPFSTYSVFPVQMIALEDVINANAAENINVQYEIQKTIGVKCWAKQKKYFRTHHRVDF